jgi:hypothetical protein
LALGADWLEILPSTQHRRIRVERNPVNQIGGAEEDDRPRFRKAGQGKFNLTVNYLQSAATDVEAEWRPQHRELCDSTGRRAKRVGDDATVAAGILKQQIGEH